MYKAAVIGCGIVHEMHTDALSHIVQAGEEIPALLAAVADIEPSRARASGEKYHCDWYTDYKEILKRKDIDSVHLCLPHDLHAPVAIEAMRAGKHVLTEKPMAISTESAQEMIRVSAETGMRLGVCFQNRYNKTNAAVKALLESGRTGRILGARAFVTWHRDRAYYNSAAWRGTWAHEGGGVLINQAIHTLDMLLWYMGEPLKLKAHVDTRLLGDCIEVEDTAEATALFESGAVLLLYLSNCYSSTSSNPFVELECEHCFIRIEDDVLVRWRSGETETIRDDLAGSGEKAYWGRSHVRLISDFYRSLEEGRPFPIDGAEGIKVLRMISAIYQSSREERYIEL